MVTLHIKNVVRNPLSLILEQLRQMYVEIFVNMKVCNSTVGNDI